MKVALSSLGLIASVLLFGLMGVNWRSAIAQNTVIYSPSAPPARYRSFTPRTQPSRVAGFNQ
ncbi:hypothetical protein QPK87_37075 [Kamptonema cortianum]|nr:hypothetical protein [Kamptonema cortianum]